MPALTAYLLLYTALYAGWGVLSPFLPAVLAGRGATAEQIGLLLAAGIAMRLVSTPLAGALAEAGGGARVRRIPPGLLVDAVALLNERGLLADPQPISCAIAAVSVGVVDGRVRLDLPYEEDSRAEVDMNVVATDAGTLVEVQGTGEGATYTRATLDAMLDSALAGCARISELQAAALAEPYPGELP